METWWAITLMRHIPLPLPLLFCFLERGGDMTTWWRARSGESLREWRGQYASASQGVGLTHAWMVYKRDPRWRHQAFVRGRILRVISVKDGWFVVTHRDYLQTE